MDNNYLAMKHRPYSTHYTEFPFVIHKPYLNMTVFQLANKQVTVLEAYSSPASTSEKLRVENELIS
jgi:hypothetical protein